jgi:outer membrane protein
MNNKKQLFINIIFALAILGAYAYRHLDKKEVVYVDSAKLLNQYQGMIDARNEYQIKATTWKANIDTLTVEVQDAIKNYEKESIKMSIKEKELSQELIRTKQKNLMDYQRAMNDKAQQEDNSMTTRVLEQVNSYLKKYGEQQGYNIVLATTEFGNVAYADESLDITDAVLEGLNQSYNGQ